MAPKQKGHAYVRITYCDWPKVPNLNCTMGNMRRRRAPAKRWRASEEEKTEGGKTECFFARNAALPFAKEEEQGSGRMFSLQKENGAKRTLLRPVYL